MTTTHDGTSPTGRKRVTVVEVGPRDGFQMEAAFIPTETKIRLLNALIDAGLRKLEVTSFVSPKAVPQLRDAREVLAGIDRAKGAQLLALVPNPRGAADAATAGVDGMVVFLSTSESHNQKNVNRSIAASLVGFQEICRIAGEAGIPVHAAIATSFGCPFEGEVPVARVVDIARSMADLGIREIALGDTTGMATPPLVRERVTALRAAIPGIELGLHFHNTRGIGLCNVMAGLAMDVASFDSSIAGLGGCPFAPGASGNICTEDLVYLLEECGFDTGIDLAKLIAVAREVQTVIGRELPGQVMKAGPRLELHSMTAVATASG